MKQSSESGFSLFEVLVATALLGLISAGVTPAFLMHFKTITDNEQRTEATSAAQVVLDGLRTLDPSTFPTSGNGTASIIDIGSRAYTVTPTYCSDSSLCSSTNTRQVSVSVARNNKEIYNVETIFTKLK